ncbi:type VII secretion protein EccE [Micromonospora craterilacus]|uniref:Type VII secretion protein EccE n=1 Tax=Micromonospora craterilacus TaxID=1655439 RepID=A0A2W2DSP3_9ACTN|nr:type VII secretion protein EccE [Micromonospora craterilacus]PZG13201.1 type VII secretion protein EccE [Micromonospora craterilacus]
MTHPGAARPGEPGWQHYPGAAAPPQQQRTAQPQQQAGGAAAPAPTVGGTGPGHSWAAQRGQGRATVGTAYTSQAAVVAQTAPAAPAARATTESRSAAPARLPAAPQPTAEAAAATPVVRPHRRQLRVAGIHLAQLVAWQAGAAAVLAATPHGIPLTVAVAAAVVLLLSPTVLRHRGRWLYQWLAVWWGYRGRRRQLTATGPDVARQLLAHLEGSVELDQVEIDDQPAVLLTHRGGLSAVLEVDPTEGALLMGAPQALPSPVSLLPAADPKTPPVAVQVLIQVTPAPRVRAAAVDRAYRELTNGAVPASRQAWVVLQAPRTPDFHADRDLRPALTAAIRRTRRQLRQDRVTARLLNRDEVLAAVAHLTHLTGEPAGGDRPLAREGWRSWSAQGTPQSCYRLLAWPDRAWELDPLLRGLPAAATVVSVSVAREPGHPGGDEAVVEVAFRLIGADAAALTAADRALDEAIRGHGGRLQRLDGEHAHGVAATLPLGGFLR